MNTVDVIFPAWPVLLYLNPALGKHLLEGLFRYQASGLYPNKWSVHDLGGLVEHRARVNAQRFCRSSVGSSYPRALGHNDGNDEAMPVEDWQIWTAAIVTDTTARDLFISSVKKYAADGFSSQPFGDWYETTNGQPEGFRARPVVGGHLARALRNGMKCS
ncbi:hypothetical protein C0992_007796 [Termitomyces sp. T32_za158]|nr:hypothetical protein C0992_007796 [Termitomyces sp. T32_za158]